MEQKAQSSISIAGESYRDGILYWGIIAVVVAIFLVTTINYWYGTIRIIDESSATILEIRRVPKGTP